MNPDPESYTGLLMSNAIGHQMANQFMQEKNWFAQRTCIISVLQKRITTGEDSQGNRPL